MLVFNEREKENSEKEKKVKERRWRRRVGGKEEVEIVEEISKRRLTGLAE